VTEAEQMVPNCRRTEKEKFACSLSVRTSKIPVLPRHHSGAAKRHDTQQTSLVLRYNTGLETLYSLLVTR
jgi:hypothetical protein